MKDSNKLVEEWLKSANDDILYAQVGFNETDLYANVCFSCQQAFEKYLKAFLLAHNISFPKTHDLTKLLILSMQIDPDFKEFEESASILTPYSTTTRYPDIGDVQFSKNQAEQAIEFAKKLQKFIQDKLR